MKKRLRKVEWREYIQVLTFVLLLFLFYSLGFPPYFIILIGVIALLFILLKGKLYKKLDDFLSKKFPFLSKLKPCAKKLIIIAVFILIYILLKQVIFMGLKMAGVDIQQIISDSINQSIK